MNNVNVPNDSPELPDISSVDTAQSAPRATALPYNNEDLVSLWKPCLEDIGRCVDAAEVAAEADHSPTRADFEIVQSRLREHRLRLNIWVSDCVAAGGLVDAITSKTEPDLFVVLVIIRENIKKETGTILTNMQQMEREAKKGNKVTDEKGPIYEAWQNIKIACDSLTFSNYELAELQDTVQMAIAIQHSRGPEAALYQAIRKVGANFKEESKLDDDELSVSSDTGDNASHVSSDERCSECQSWLPWHALPHHKKARHDTFDCCQTGSQASPVRWQPSGTKDQDTLPDTGSHTISGLVMSAVQSFVNIAAKVTYNSVRIGYKVLDDMNTKIVADTISTGLKVEGDFSSTRTKVAGDLVVILAKIRSDFVANGTKIANDIGNTANNILRGDDAPSILKSLTRNTLSTVVNVLEDSIKTITMIIAVLSCTLAKVLSDSFSTASKVVNNYLSTVDLVTTDVETMVLNLRATTTTAVRAANRQLGSRAAEVFLKYAVNVFTAAGNTAAVDTILQLAHRSLQAATQMLSEAGLTLRGILNGINEDTLFFILKHLHDLLGFLYDLMKPGNVVPAYPANYVIKIGPSEADEFPDGNNPYNEFDLRREQNRYAIACQLQRVGLTFINILQMGRETSRLGLDNLEMNVRLSSDFDANGSSPSPIYISRLEEKLESPRNEKWLFINGIANELTWFQRSCDKIRDTFKREVHGIYNRSDGILWDLIECCGERSAVRKRSNELIERTWSSRAAQECLEKELTDALWPTDSSASDKVIMIAHSQGCLILRLVLQKLVSENPVGLQSMRDMKKRLRVFTFGNPSIDWLATTSIGEPAQSLGEYASVTEHFAHEVDFVARLGIVTHSADPDSGYDADSIFYSKKGRGHLFGAHYPLAENAYINAGRSKLLSAVDGRAIY